MTPPKARWIKSDPLKVAHGPSSPNGVIRAVMSSGKRSFSAAWSSLMAVFECARRGIQEDIGTLQKPQQRLGVRVDVQDNGLLAAIVVPKETASVPALGHCSGTGRCALWRSPRGARSSPPSAPNPASSSPVYSAHSFGDFDHTQPGQHPWAGVAYHLARGRWIVHSWVGFLPRGSDQGRVARQHLEQDRVSRRPRLHRRAQ